MPRHKQLITTIFHPINIRIIKIDIDQYPAIASEYNVRGVPTLAIFKNGQLLWKESGVHDVNTLTNLLKQHQ